MSNWTIEDSLIFDTLRYTAGTFLFFSTSPGIGIPNTSYQPIFKGKLIYYDPNDPTPADLDSDGIPNLDDNCPIVFNPSQADSDLDGIGDVCDICPLVYDPDQEDSNDDGIGDACCCQSSGNVDGVIGPGGPVDVADIIYLITYLFQGNPTPPCPDEADVCRTIGCNEGPGSPDRWRIDVRDLLYLVAYLFQYGQEPEPCP
jgi:hypothetical protein